ncbi:hypothetical protein TWF173_000818 [Orbilia oligospora]|nr:hypothetical protein TWF173_000818 [Orbilia oligospora]
MTMPSQPWIYFFQPRDSLHASNGTVNFFFASDLSFFLSFFAIVSALLVLRYFRVFISAQPFYPKSVPACSTLLLQPHRDGAMFFQRLFIPLKAKRFFILTS